MFITLLFISQPSVRAVLARDSFCASEIDIFQAVRRWAEQNADADLASVMSAVRLPLMSLEELLNVVRNSALVSADAILDSINVKTTRRDTELCYRGALRKSEEEQKNFQLRTL